MFLEAMADYIDISDSYDEKSMKIDAYMESVLNELTINIMKSDLKVFKESGSVDDYDYLVEAAEESAGVKIKKAIQAVIDAFLKFIKDLKDRVVRIVVSKTTRQVLNKIEKKVKLNPFFARKKVTILNKRIGLGVINKYKDQCERQMAKTMAGIFKESEIEGIFKMKDSFEAEYKAVSTGAKAAITITVASLIKEINSDLNKLPDCIKKIDKETTESVKRFCKSVDDKEVIASTKAAFTTCANFRTKLGKAEANEYVDFIMNGISVLKTNVAKMANLDTATEVEDIGNTNESVDEFMSFLDDDNGYSFESGYDTDQLMDELEDLLND